MAGAIIDQIQSAVMEGRYRFTDHALEELEADNLHPSDVEAALLNGRVVATRPAEIGFPGPRYTVRGLATDLSARIEVVVRFDNSQSLLLITAYVLIP